MHTKYIPNAMMCVLTVIKDYEELLNNLN